MLVFTLSFLIGGFVTRFFIVNNLYLLTFLIPLPALWWFRKYKITMLAIPGVILGFVYTAYYTNHIERWVLPHDKEQIPLTLIGKIASLPRNENDATKFNFLVTRVSAANYKQHPASLIKVTWSKNQNLLKVGDEWQLVCKLKRIHGVASPGAFNYEAVALSQGLRASGYVVNSENNKFINHHPFFHPIDQLRQSLQFKLQQSLPATSTAHWLYALIIGEHSNISAAEWQVLRNTGTNHLMAIAGLHIGLIAFFIHTLVSFIWRRIPHLALRLPAMEAGAYGAMTIAILYSALAGFSLPTQRACIMLVLYLGASVNRIHTNPWHIWSCALLIVLLLNPLSILSDSFWLSFCTLALITYGMGARIAPTGQWWKHGRVQWVIGLGLIPLSILLFLECSFISFLVNSIAIPWLGFLVLPFCLLATLFLYISPTAASGILFIADKCLAGLWQILTFAANLPISSWHIAAPNVFIWILVCLACLMLLIPIGMPGRWFSLCLFLSLIFYQPPPIAPGEVRLSLLDVAQGLSAVVQTQHHVLLFDAGPKLSDNMDFGQEVVVPYLLIKRITKIDLLMVSHEDNDHIGGVQSVADIFKIKRTLTSVPNKLSYLHAGLCQAGGHWQWDGVNFTILYPGENNYGRDNDSSCVLKIDNGKQSILLPGDIEKYAEKKMLHQTDKSLSSTIIVAPHHGSKTSAVSEFVNQVHPSIVLFSTGYQNKYHFPNVAVMQIYSNLGAKLYNTVEMGTMEWEIPTNGLAYLAQYARHE